MENGATAVSKGVFDEALRTLDTMKDGTTISNYMDSLHNEKLDFTPSGKLFN